MKLGLLLSVFVLFSCSSARHWTGSESTVDDDAFSREQAERILGVEIAKAEVDRGDGCVVHDKCWRFTGSGAGSIYAVVDVHRTDSAGVAARYAWAVRRLGLKDSNRVAGVGDEAHLRSSPHQFWLSARKGLYTVDFSIAPTSHTTTAEFLRVAGEVVGRLNLD